MEQQLTETETGLIDINRAFWFLRKEGFVEKELCLPGRELPTVVYHAPVKRMAIRIMGNEQLPWTITIERRFGRFLWERRRLIDISDHYANFGASMHKNGAYTLSAQANFIQSHLMPIIRGELWIGDLLAKHRADSKNASTITSNT
jgi:hypothetical protein